MTILHLEASLLDLAVAIDVEGLDEELRQFVLKVVEIKVRQQPARSKACGSRSACVATGKQKYIIVSI
jgi:hypothetical protein